MNLDDEAQKEQQGSTILKASMGPRSLLKSSAPELLPRPGQQPAENQKLRTAELAVPAHGPFRSNAHILQMREQWPRQARCCFQRYIATVLSEPRLPSIGLLMTATGFHTTIPRALLKKNPDPVYSMHIHSAPISP